MFRKETSRESTPEILAVRTCLSKGMSSLKLINLCSKLGAGIAVVCVKPLIVNNNVNMSSVFIIYCLKVQ
jgi:hypothetical protein